MHDSATKGKKRSWTYGKSSKKALRGVAKAMATSIAEDIDTRSQQIAGPVPGPVPGKFQLTKTRNVESQHGVAPPRSVSRHEKLVARPSEELADTPPVYQPMSSMSGAYGVPKNTFADRLSVKRQSPANAVLPEGKRRKLQRRNHGDGGSPTKLGSDNELSSSSSITSHSSLICSRLSSPIQDVTKLRGRATLRQPNNDKPNRASELSRAQRSEHLIVPSRNNIEPSASQAMSSHETTLASRSALDTSTSGNEEDIQQQKVKCKGTRRNRTSQNVENISVANPGSLPIPQLSISSQPSPPHFEGLDSPSQALEQPSYLSKLGSPARPKLREKLKSKQDPDHDHGSCDPATSGEEVTFPDEMSAKQKKEVKNHGCPQEELDVSAVVQNRGSRLTYAAGNRTLLQETDDLLLHHSINAKEGSGSSRRIRELPSPAQRRAIREEDQEEENSTQSAISSIHELRQAGHRQRLSRRADALFDDIETDSSTAGRRLTLISIVKELQSPAFMQQWLNSVRDNQLLALIDTGSDPILDLLLIIAIYLIASHGPYASVLQPQFLEKLSPLVRRCLDQEEDLSNFVQDPKYQVPTSLQEDILTICNSILASPLWQSSKASETSCCLLDLVLLERLVRQSREAGSTENLLSREILDGLIRILTTFHYSSREARLASSKSCFRLALSILESSAITYSFSEQDCERVWAKRNIRDLSNLIPRILTDTERDEQLVSLAMRLCLNLSNRNLWVCKLFSEPDVIQTTLRTVEDYFSKLSARNADSEHNLVLDNLVLGLGFLINLCEKLQSTRELFLEPHGNVMAPIEVILNLFLDRLPSAFEVGDTCRLLAFC